MKKSYLIICVIWLTLIMSDIAKATIPVVWQADPDGSGLPDPSVTGNEISRVKLTPDKNNVMVFHYNGGAYGIPTRVDKLDASTGNFVWPLPGYKTVTKPGERISLNGWVDGSGNLFIMGSWSGNTIWKYDSELATELCSYTGGSGFEYVEDAMTDEFDNIYVSGMTGSGSNQGSRLVKLDANCNEIWTCLSKNTSQKDDYCHGIALDSSKNGFRVGADRAAAYVSFRGRLIGHNASDGTEFCNYIVDELNSNISGIAIDSDDYIYIAYNYGDWPSGQERTVVQKLERVGSTANVVWEYRFEDIGMCLASDAIVKHTGNSFYVAFNLRQGGTTVPGIAEFDLNGNLLWKDTIDRPGWNLASGIDAAGDYIYVGLTNNADGSQTQVLCLASVLEPTEPPIADAGDDIIADANEEVTLDGSGSSDPDGQIIKYTWKRLPDGVIIYSGNEPTCQTKALGRVEEVIELTVTDNQLATATDTVKIINRIIKRLQQQGQDRPPVANAGPDQTVYAGMDRMANVTLDGSGSSDPEGQTLTYRWRWTIGSQNHRAAGPRSVIRLPVGQHTIQLIVNDGMSDSEPDQVVITVVEPIEAQLRVFPRVINRSSKMTAILALIRLPEGVMIDDVACDRPLLLYPGEIEAKIQHIIPPLMGQFEQVRILASFDKQRLMNAVPNNGEVELRVVGRLKSGRRFYGTDTIRIIEPGAGPP